MKSKKGLTIFLMFIALITAGLFIAFFLKFGYDQALEQPNSDSTETIKFEIITGESLDTIVPSLVNQGLLKEESRNYFIFYLKRNNLVPNIQAGSFEIPKNLNIMQLAETLQRAQEPSVWVTIPEGLRLDETAQIIANQLLNINQQQIVNTAKDKEFIASFNLNAQELDTLEGFLYPDKYLIKKEATAREVLTMMVNTFKEKVTQDYTYEDIILASLIEREAVNPEDRRIISGILQKRLQEQWLLQVDATLLFYHQDWTHVIYVQDKEIDHPYNTYMHHGLTPTPICSPGIDSISSVFEAEETEFYYYIHDNDRNPHYSKTLAEHEQKVQQYLR